MLLSKEYISDLFELMGKHKVSSVKLPTEHGLFEVIKNHFDDPVEDNQDMVNAITAYDKFASLSEDEQNQLIKMHTKLSDLG